MARCLNCNNELKPESRFCSRCGTANNQIAQSVPGFSCQGCGNQNPFGSSNCASCGRPLPPTPPIAPAAGINCPSCGTSNYPNTPYCMACGRPMPSSDYTYRQPANRSGPYKSRRALVFVSIALVLAATLVVGLWKPGYLWQLIDNDPLIKADRNSSRKGSENNPKPSASNGGSPQENFSSGVMSEDWMNDYLAKDPGTNPAPMPVSGTKAFSVSPADGITLSAEENALDQERHFIAEKLSDESIIGLMRQYPNVDWLILGGYEVDAGLSPDERLPGTLKVDMDLSKMNIPQAMWPYTQAVRIGHDGSISLLPSKVDGSTLSCHTSQNSILGAVFIGLTGGVFVQHLIELGHEGLQDLYIDVKFHHTTINAVYSSYDVYWPETMMSAATREFYEKESALKKKYGLNPDGSLNSAALAATKNFTNGYEMAEYLNTIKNKLFSDPEYIELAKLMKDVDWNEANYWPTEVAQTIRALKQADRYLFGIRKFNTPGYNVDVVVLDRWPSNHGSPSAVLGISMNLYTFRPFIHINASKSQQKIPRTASEVKTLATQSLLMTMTHELFHVVQSRYMTWDQDKYTIFWEAMAVSLEKEAFDFFSSEAGGKHIDPANTTVLTDRGYFQNLLSHSLLTPSLWKKDNDDKGFIRDHGYTASHWLDFLRDRYYAQNPDEFLLSLLSRFSGSAPAEDDPFNRILREQTRNDGDASYGSPYSMDFIAFCQANFKEYYGRIQYTSPPIKDIILNAEHPVAEIKTIWQPLSTTLQDFKIDSKGADGKPCEYRIVVKGRLPWDNYFITRNFVSGSVRKTVEVDQELVMLPYGSTNILTLMEIQAQSEEVTSDEERGTYEIFMLRQPEEPEMMIDEDYLVITPPDWSIPDPGQLLAGYDIIITGPGGAEYRHVAEVSLAEVEIPLKEIKPKDKARSSAEDTDKFTAYIVERIELPDGTFIYGPDGKVAELDDELRFEDIIGQWDMVQTVSNFDSKYMDGLLTQMEGVEGMDEYLQQYGEYFQNVDGTYNGIMTINQTGTNTANVGFTTTESGNSGTVFYSGVWANGILHLTPSGAVLGGDWDLRFEKKKNIVTCEGESTFADQMASYSYTLTATKKN